MFGNGVRQNAQKDPERRMPEPVRRIDWNQCTILAGDVPRSEASGDGDAGIRTVGDTVPDDVLSALKALFDRVVFDDSLPLYVATLDGRLVHVNDGYATLARGRTGEGARSATGVGGLPVLPAGLLSVVEEVRMLGKSITLEEKVRVAGQYRYYRSRHFPISDPSGAIIAVGGTYVDCTAQVEGLANAQIAQQRFMDFARASSDWFWECDRDGCLTMLSDRLTALVGKPATTLIGTRIGEAGRFRADEYDQSPAIDAMAAHRSFRDQLYEMTTADGVACLFYLSGVPVFDVASGEFSGYRGAGMDVTDRMVAERESREIRQNLEITLEELTNRNVQLDIASAEAEHALRVKNEFLAAMSHELRTPLNAVIGFAEAMKMEVFGELSSNYRSYSSDIMSAGHHLLGLINDVLDVAVLESNRISLDPEHVSLAKVVDSALNLVIMRANTKRLDTTSVAVGGDWTIEVDVRRATQIFVNLFSNAVKFTPEGGRVGIDIAAHGPGQVAATVWDTGIGIPADKQDLVFEKFQQVHDAVYSRPEEGTGLGLHISRHLARLMGGDIILRSQPGKGSRFTVTLPLALD